jgi:hypothetical protein
VHVARFSDGARLVTHITECVGMEFDTITTQDIFPFERKGILSNGRVTGQFRATGIRPKFYETLRTAGHELPSSMAAAALVWWYAQSEKRRQRVVRNLPSNVDPDRAVVTTVLIQKPGRSGGLAGLVKTLRRFG